jgi:hypothetical protein
VSGNPFTGVAAGAGLGILPTNPKALDVPIMADAGGQLR